MIRVVALLMALYVSVPAFAAEKDTEFNLSDRQIIASYNDSQLPSSDPLTFRQGNTDGTIFRQYNLPPMFTLTFWYNSEGGNPTYVVLHGKKGRPTDEDIDLSLKQLYRITAILNQCRPDEVDQYLKGVEKKTLKENEKIDLEGGKVWMQFKKKDGTPMMSYAPWPQQSSSNTKPHNPSSTTLPQYDIKAYCKQVADISGGSAMIEKECRRLEKVSFNAIQKMSVPAKTMRYCDQVARVGGGSYSTLQGCIEMELGAAEDL